MNKNIFRVKLKAYTLTEILVVLVIIGILVLLALGNEIKRIIDDKVEKTFVVKTTQSTNDVYGSDEQSLNNQQRGSVNGISRNEATITEKLIKSEQYSEAHATGNLIELPTLSQRQLDAKHLLQDNGKGGTGPSNNREYGVTTNFDGSKKLTTGSISNPSEGGANVKVSSGKNVFYDSHSHPSGTVTKNGSTFSFFPQGPSKDDINDTSVEHNNVVFGRGSNKVYIYNSNGISAIMSTINYLK